MATKFRKQGLNCSIMVWKRKQEIDGRLGIYLSLDCKSRAKTCILLYLFAIPLFASHSLYMQSFSRCTKPVFYKVNTYIQNTYQRTYQRTDQEATSGAEIWSQSRRAKKLQFLKWLLEACSESESVPIDCHVKMPNFTVEINMFTA